MRVDLEGGNLGAAIADCVDIACTGDGVAELPPEHGDLIRRLTQLTSEGLELELGAALARAEARLAMRRLRAGAPILLMKRELSSWKRVVLEPLARVLPQGEARPLDWAEVRLLWTLLAICNHAGSLSGAASALAALQGKLATLAGDLAHVPLLLEVRFAEAVHLTDSFAHARACEAMDKLADDLESLVGLVGDITATRTGALRSRLIGKALGTSLQAWHKRGRRDPAAYEEARLRSDRGLQFFTAEDDLQRQAGYRTLLEADAGFWPQALEYLGRAVGADASASPAEMLKLAISSPRSETVPWKVMYWTHFWYVSVVKRGVAHGEAFLRAWKQYSVATKQDWLGGEWRYPGHVVAWKAGVAAWRADRTRPKQGRRLLDRALEHCFAQDSGEATRLVGLGVLGDYAALEVGPARAARCQRLLAEVEAQRTCELEPVREYLAPWVQVLQNLPRDEHEQEAVLQRLAWDLPY